MYRLFPRIDFSFPPDYNLLQGSERRYVFVSATPINRDSIVPGPDRNEGPSLYRRLGFWRREMRS